MNIEFKLQGRRLDNGALVQGYYYFDGKSHWILKKGKGFCHADEVDPGTVGQYIGKKDKKGIEIYEDDTVSACWYSYEEPLKEARGKVYFCEERLAYCVMDAETNIPYELNPQGCYCLTIEVIREVEL